MKVEDDIDFAVRPVLMANGSNQSFNGRAFREYRIVIITIVVLLFTTKLLLL